MFNQYFGNYLLNKELLTSEQLIEALDYQQTVHVKIGVIAIDEGFMTSHQVDEVHEKQKQMDKRFGEIAVERGYLTENQLDRLLSAQKQDYLLLAQALVDKGFMSMDQFSSALIDYKKEHQLSDDSFEAIKDGNVDELLKNVVVPQLKDVYQEYLTLFAKNMLRFIDDQVYVEIDDSTLDETDWIIFQEITGDSPLQTIIAGHEDVLIAIASAYAEETLTEMDELAQASVSEFLNLHNGVFLVNQSNEGTELNLKPQTILQNAKPTGNLLTVKVHTSKGSFRLSVSHEPEQVTFQQAEGSTTN